MDKSESSPVKPRWYQLRPRVLVFLIALVVAFALGSWLLISVDPDGHLINRLAAAFSRSQPSRRDLAAQELQNARQALARNDRSGALQYLDSSIFLWSSADAYYERAILFRQNSAFLHASGDLAEAEKLLTQYESFALTRGEIDQLREAIAQDIQATEQERERQRVARQAELAQLKAIQALKAQLNAELDADVRQVLQARIDKLEQLRTILAQSPRWAAHPQERKLRLYEATIGSPERLAEIFAEETTPQ